jgi:hypothetical protein
MCRFGYRFRDFVSLRLGVHVRCGNALLVLVIVSLGSVSPADATQAPVDEVPPSVPVTHEIPHYADLSVTAVATKEGDPDGEPRAVDVDVFINGRHVGLTPYEDGLPTGAYRVEVKSEGRILLSKMINVSAGESYHVQAKSIIPLTAAEREEIERKRREAFDAEQRVLAEEWAAIRGRYEAENQRIGEERRPFAIAGTVLFLGGLGLMIGGTIFEVLAVREDERLDDLKEDYVTETDMDELARLENEIYQAKYARRVNNAFGVTFLVVGPVSIVTSIVLWSVMPSRPEEPIAPPGLLFAGVGLQPLIAPDFVGMGLHSSF